MSNIKVIEFSGKKPGNTLVILAGVHGNEVCGVDAFNELISKIKIEAGKVYLIYANLEAIKQNKRFVEYNLNRTFFKNQPSRINNCLEGKTAKEIMPYLDKADAMLDIHASFTRESIPFVICDKRWLNEAKMFDTKLASYNWDEFEPGSTDYYMNIRSKPGFCFECGSLYDANSTKRAEKAILSFLAYYKCISGKIELQEDQRIIKITGLYRNRESRFVKTRSFKDFEKFNKKTLIGMEDNQKIYRNKGDIVLFVRDAKELDEECFLFAREVNQKVNKTSSSSRGGTQW